MTAALTPPAGPNFVPLRTVRRIVHRIEDDGYGAAQQLVYQRDDLIAAASPENNRLLEQALRVEGLPPLARELIQRALAVEIAEEQAVARAHGRRETAHFHLKAIGSRCELAATGRQRGRLRRVMTSARQMRLLEGNDA